MKADQDDIGSVHVAGPLETDLGMDVVGLERQAWSQDVVDAYSRRPGVVTVDVPCPSVLGAYAEGAGFIGGADIPLPVQVGVAVELPETSPTVKSEMPIWIPVTQAVKSLKPGP